MSEQISYAILNVTMSRSRTRKIKKRRLNDVSDTKKDRNMTKLVYLGLASILIITVYVTFRHTEPIQNFEQNAMGVLSKNKGYLFQK